MSKAEFKPKRMWAYHVPEVFKPDVEKQIRELLDMGLISQSDGQSDRLRGQEKWRGTFGCGLSVLKFIYSS